MNKKPKKLNEAQERRVKELDNLQQSLQGNLELGCARVREEAEIYRRGQMTGITHKVMPIKKHYEKTRKQAEQTKNRAINDAHKAFSVSEDAARAEKRQALASIEEEVDNLGKEVERRVAEGEAELNKEFNKKLQVIVQERQAIRGGDKPQVQDVSDQPAVQTTGPEEPSGKAVGVS